jgi:putative transcriptional regulator
MEDTMAVSLRIGELARQQGLTIKALAERAGVAYNTAHTLYTGRATRIDLDTLDRICAALQVAPGDVFIRHAAPDRSGREHETGVGHSPAPERAPDARDRSTTGPR